MSIDLQIEQILKIKKELYASIKEKGVEFDRKKEFAEYPNEVKKITGGGGSISGQEFTITNNTGSDIKQGDTVWVDWAPYVESESKINEVYKGVEVPTLLDQSGKYAFNGMKGQCFYIDGLTVTNPNFNFTYPGLIPNSYYISQSGEVFSSLNYVFNASEPPFRSDLVYCEIGSKLKSLIPGETNNSYRQTVYFVGENYFLRIANNPPDGYAKAQVFQVDTSTAKILKQWKLLNVPEKYDDLKKLATSWILHENNKTFLYVFYHGKKYELSMSSSEDLPVSEPLDGISLGTIFPVGFTQNGELMFARTIISGSTTYYPLQIFKKGTNIDDWTLLSSNDLSSNISSYYGNSDLDFIYNPTNQVITISSEKSRNTTNGIPGKAFRFVGINESGKVIFEELPCDLSQFIQTPGSKWEDGVYYPFAPTYSQDCGKYVISKQIPSNLSPDNKSHYQYLVGYAKTGIFLKAAKDPSKLGAFAIQGVAKQNIANNSSGQIDTLALEKVNIQLNSDVELDDILVSTGV